ncbi:MAG: hypothetical protein IT508_09860, partial [Burkholderiaceae bacterium]|nr:hypothetical protein [Burkholderiaceae bacterium]
MTPGHLLPGPGFGASPPDSYRSSLRWLATSRVAVALLLMAFVALHDNGRLVA